MKNLIIFFLFVVIAFLYVNRGFDSDYAGKLKQYQTNFSQMLGKMKNEESRAELKQELSQKMSTLKAEFSELKGDVADQMKKMMTTEEGLKRDGKKERNPSALLKNFMASDPEGSTKQNKIQWDSDINRALGRAKSEGKQVMVDFMASWCGWCKKLDKTTYSDPEVINLVNENFIATKIDGDRRPDLIREYRVPGYPFIVFLSAEGDVVYQYPGYITPEAFIQVLQEVIR